MKSLAEQLYLNKKCEVSYSYGDYKSGFSFVYGGTSWWKGESIIGNVCGLTLKGTKVIFVCPDPYTAFKRAIKAGIAEGMA